jgi:hypothetical protein
MSEVPCPQNLREIIQKQQRVLGCAGARCPESELFIAITGIIILLQREGVLRDSIAVVSDLFNKKRVSGFRWPLTPSGSLNRALHEEGSTDQKGIEHKGKDPPLRH